MAKALSNAKRNRAETANTIVFYWHGILYESGASPIEHRRIYKEYRTGSQSD
jgi:hypothetical protein